MNPATSNIDASAVKEALMRRLQGQQPMPAGAQMSQPAQSSPTGASPTPTQIPTPAPRPQTPTPQFSSAFARPATASKSGESFDDDTRRIAKSLISKLISVL